MSNSQCSNFTSKCNVCFDSSKLEITESFSLEKCQIFRWTVIEFYLFLQRIVWMWWNKSSWSWDEMVVLSNVPEGDFPSVRAISKFDRKSHKIVVFCLMCFNKLNVIVSYASWLLLQLSFWKTDRNSIQRSVSSTDILPMKIGSQMNRSLSQSIM